MSDDRIYTQADLEAAVSAVRAEVEQWRQANAASVADECRQHRRAESAEADLRALREGLEALANDWEAQQETGGNGRLGFRALEYADTFADDLRALLAPSPAEGTGEAGCREGMLGENTCAEHGGEWVYEDDGVTVLPECSRADEFRATTEARCEASGYSVAHCKAIDLCDCFPDGRLHPEAFVVGAPVSSGEVGRTLGCMWCDEDSCNHGAMRAERESGETGQVATRWVDSQGDVWTFDADGIGTNRECANFSRKYVEKKWGPLRPAPVVTPSAEGGES